MIVPIGDHIRELREAKGWSINKLAREAGIAYSYLRSVELNEINPTVEKVEYICNTLGITLKDFFDTEISDVELLEGISNLSVKQKQALINFLKTL